ncbi:MAG: hypothetical protein M3270_07965 [Thermoproteota archaeon]|nr:hypothetical protein [Thermoproteota archaeon]
MFADDAILHGPAAIDVLPWGLVYNGRGGAAKFFKLLESRLNLTSLS